MAGADWLIKAVTINKLHFHYMGRHCPVRLRYGTGGGSALHTRMENPLKQSIGGYCCSRPLEMSSDILTGIATSRCLTCGKSDAAIVRGVLPQQFRVIVNNNATRPRPSTCPKCHRVRPVNSYRVRTLRGGVYGYRWSKICVDCRKRLKAAQAAWREKQNA